MRIWSLHPQYLDAKGLVALWRETLLAKHVLEGKTKGYKNHPQLDRFKRAEYPLGAINLYLMEVLNEALRRNYNFNKEKINYDLKSSKLKVTHGQLAYEWEHLSGKLEKRDTDKYSEIKKLRSIIAHPLFEVVEGGVEKWETAAQH